MRDCLLLRNEMSAMTIAVQYYLTFEVIEGEWADTRAWLKVAC